MPSNTSSNPIAPSNAHVDPNAPSTASLMQQLQAIGVITSFDISKLSAEEKTALQRAVRDPAQHARVKLVFANLDAKNTNSSSSNPQIPQHARATHAVQQQAVTQSTSNVAKPASTKAIVQSTKARVVAQPAITKGVVQPSGVSATAKSAKTLAKSASARPTQQTASAARHRSDTAKTVAPKSVSQQTKVDPNVQAKPAVSPEEISANSIRQLHNYVEKTYIKAASIAKYVINEEKRKRDARVKTTLYALEYFNNPEMREKRANEILHENAGVEEQASHAQIDTSKTTSNDQSKSTTQPENNRDAEKLNLHDTIKAECDTIVKNNSIIRMSISEEFGKPVIRCILLIPEIRLPALTLRVQNGYPEKDTITYVFDIPPLGWIDILEMIRERFHKRLADSATEKQTVAMILMAWASVAESVVITELRSLHSDDDELDNILSSMT